MDMRSCAIVVLETSLSLVLMTPMQLEPLVCLVQIALHPWADSSAVNTNQDQSGLSFLSSQTSEVLIEVDRVVSHAAVE